MKGIFLVVAPTPPTTSTTTTTGGNAKTTVTVEMFDQRPPGSFTLSQREIP